MFKLITIATVVVASVSMAHAQQRVSTPCTETALPAKAGANYATIKVLRPMDGASVDDVSYIRLYLSPEKARLDNDGKIDKVYACPGNTVGFRLKATGTSNGFLLFELPVPPDAGDIPVVACNDATKNCFRVTLKPGQSAKLEAYDRPTVQTPPPATPTTPTTPKS